MCTRVFSNTGPILISGRTMDWPTSTEPLLVISPRGQIRNGGKLGPMTLNTDNPLIWTSRYGNVAVSIYGLGTVDGLNEKGFTAHALYLTSTELPESSPDLPDLQMSLWVQYLLDTAATVTEALALMDGFQLMMVEAKGRKSTIHLALADAEGDSAVIEFVDGVRTVHHGREYRVMTNDPPFDEQLTLLDGVDFSDPSSELPLPGNVNPRDRFQRASYYLDLMPQEDRLQPAVAGLLAILRNASVPFGAPYKGFGVYNTEYRAVSDLTDLVYFFELSTSPSLIWLDLKSLDFSEGLPMSSFDPYAGMPAGDVSDQFSSPAEVLY